MNDRTFLSWLHDRLQHVHGENPMVDYMGKLRSIIEATPLDQATPNTAPDLENIRLATDVMTIDVGDTVKAGGREWRMEAEPIRDHNDRNAHHSPTQRVYFTDVASPAADGQLDHTKDYHLQVWHIREVRADAMMGGALASRATWSKRFTSGQYTFDPQITDPAVASDQG